MKSFSDILDGTRVCPFCNVILLLDECREHIRPHIEKESPIKSVYIPFDKRLFPSDPDSLYICSYCDCVPPETLSGNPRDEITRHIERGECPACPPKHALITFRVIHNKEVIKEIVDNYPIEKKVEVFFCPERDEEFHRIEDLIEHYIAKHLFRPTKDLLLEELKYNRLNENISVAIEELLNTQPVVIERIIENPQLHTHHRHITQTITTVPVPRKRSILKHLAGIEDEELITTSRYDYEPEEDDEFTDPPKPEKPDQAIPASQPRYIKKELKYTNILYGHIHLTKDVKSLIDDSLEQVELFTDQDEQFIGDIHRDQKIILVGQKLTDWFETNGLIAGCYLYLYPDEKGRIEIAYTPTLKPIKKCLKATWDENKQIVILKYEDVEVMADCSEHLFRSSVNLGDPRVLNFMANLYGSVFDVLYLGMRDLFQSGIEMVHYRDLHNMAIFGRLHPQLGSVFAELRKNPCFKKLGEGYWGFEPDKRIEEIIPAALKTSHVELQEEDKDRMLERQHTKQALKEALDAFNIMISRRNQEKLLTLPNETTVTSETEPVVVPESKISPHLEGKQSIPIESKETIYTGSNSTIQQEKVVETQTRIKRQTLKAIRSIKGFLKDLYERFSKTFLKF